MDRLRLGGSAFKAADVEMVLSRVSQVGFAHVTEVCGDFDYPAELIKLGAAIPQYDGQHVRDIKPDPRLPACVYSALSMDELLPHTEWHEFPGLPPRYVVLWCVQAAKGNEGQTTLADGYRYLSEFSAVERRLMHENVYEWHGLPGLPHPSSAGFSRHPILIGHPTGPIMRYSSGCVRLVEDGLISRYVEGGKRFFARHQFPVHLGRGDILIWDNWRMMHARRSFADPARHLCRMLLAHR